MKLTIIALLSACAFPALAETFPGADAAPCDAEKFTPVYGADGTVLYWLNPTCTYAGSGGGASNAASVIVSDVDGKP